ncbi:nuclear transport factor 2 family protein [Bosea caraganae]|uniref:Nuclear transport factor 2 family protein n=1 Tax=Bosea caraganae TaxID=2763117 RepID=A0A370L5D2_9HYPH|nr:nuclear transport factor 2 family protein [Bosea caraganae]RDJ24253.1 nuclear transport factor 2 family protein [Bosea caraganae]RDJ30295.1 nuclear transport factor 2 family protein [Bosea caraganae]
MPTSLQEPIAAYFAATNRHDVAAMLALFATDAVVHDEGQIMAGHAVIRTWIVETIRKYHARAKVTDVQAADGRTIVTCEVSGNFPGSPASIRFAFTLAGAAIARLEIG